VITSINGIEKPNLDALLAYMNGLHARQSVQVGVVRGNGAHSVLPLTLSTRAF
jgi:S1-C subfamily serine protease